MAQKSYRVIAKNTGLRLRTVNVVVNAPPNKVSKSVIQIAAPPVKGIVETVMDSGGTIPGLPTIHVPGYAGPL